MASVRSVKQLEYFDIKLMFCGWDNNVPDTSNNPPIKHFALHFIYEGEGVYGVNGKKYKISKGDVLFAPPDTPYYTRTSSDNRLKLYYIAFTGPNCETFMHRAGFNDTNAVVKSDSEYILPKIKNVYDLMGNNSFTSIMKANAEFLDILCSLFEKLPENYELRDKPISTYTMLVEEYIQKNYNEDIKISDICNYIHLSRTYLSSVFKKIKGVSIKDYITRYRIERAADMLRSTELSVTEIALRCGFNNSVSFYRQFRSIMIASPRYYRMKGRKDKIKSE